MKTKFQYSRTYTFESHKGKRKHYFFNLIERLGDGATLQLRDKDTTDLIPVVFEMEGEVETAKFVYKGMPFVLRADQFIPKGYPLSEIGRLEKKEDALRDAHLHTIHNREEVEKSQITCYCISCQTFFHPSEIDSYADGGETAICPNCGIDAVIGDACGFRLSDELLGQLHDKYFSYDDIEEDPELEIYVATDLMLSEGAYRFNAVYTFKSMTSVKSYEKYLKATGEDHKLIVTPRIVSSLDEKLSVITEFIVKDGLPEYKSTRVFEEYDDAWDYKKNLKENHPEIEVEFDTVKIRSRFSPQMLHCGWIRTLNEFKMNSNDI